MEEYSMETVQEEQVEEACELPLEEAETPEEDLTLEVEEQEPLPEPVEPEQRTEEQPEQQAAERPESDARENRVRAVGAKALRNSLAAFSARHPELSPELMREIAVLTAEERHRANVEFSVRRESAERQRRERSYAAFVENYPEITDFEREIPKEVFEKVRAGEDIVSAYRAYENRKLREELEALKTEQKNRAASLGSARGAGEDEYDEFLEGFFS